MAYGNSTREKVRVSNAALLKTSRAVVGFWLYHCLERREMTEGPLRDLFARAARGELEPRSATTYPLPSEVRRATRTSRRAAPRASCCWTPTLRSLEGTQ